MTDQHRQRRHHGRHNQRVVEEVAEVQESQVVLQMIWKKNRILLELQKNHQKVQDINWMKRSVMIVEKIKINIGKIWILILFMIVLMVPSMLIKAEDNKQVPAIIESFKINNTKEECNFTYNLEEATEWMY